VADDLYLQYSLNKQIFSVLIDNLRILNTNSRDAQDILSSASRSYLDSSYCGPWDAKAIKLVDNKELEEKYR